MNEETELNELRAKYQSCQIDLSNAERQLAEVREVLGLGKEATHPVTLSAIGQLKDKLRAVRRRARLAATVGAGS